MKDKLISFNFKNQINHRRDIGNRTIFKGKKSFKNKNNAQRKMQKLMISQNNGIGFSANSHDCLMLNQINCKPKT